MIQARVVLLAAAVLAPVVVAADVSVNVNVGVPAPPAIVVPAPPALVVVPGVPLVQYAPSLHVDLFFHERSWYYSHGGYWYVGPSYKGPWSHIVVGHLPPPLLAVPVHYYKVPPGHLKHGKGGPPGHGKGKGKVRD